MTEQLRVKADLVALRAIAPWVGEIMAREFRTEQVAPVMPAIELAIQEIAVNIVEHGYGSEGEVNHLDVELTVRGHVAELVLIDHGPAYDPAEIAEPEPDAPQVGGYGLMIVRQLTTAFGVERHGNTNRTRLCFEVPRPIQALTKQALTKQALTKQALTKQALTKQALTKQALTKQGAIYADDDPSGRASGARVERTSRRTLRR